MEFEKSWTKRPAGNARIAGFGVMLDIANVQELSEKSWIADAAAIEPFCSAMAEVLEQMPKDEEGLVKAFQEKKLYRFALDQFAGFAHREKFYSFKEFVGSLQRGSARSEDAI